MTVPLRKDFEVSCCGERRGRRRSAPWLGGFWLSLWNYEICGVTLIIENRPLAASRSLRKSTTSQSLRSPELETCSIIWCGL
jgi:hypothetical protein